MLQMENINKIEYLKQVIEELKIYSISLDKENQKLDLLISNYKLKKEQEQKEESLVLNHYRNPETELSVELMKLEMDLEIYILFLELVHLTENWDLNVSLDKFETIENKLEKIVLTFGDMDLQKEIYKRYHNLLLKKIIQDYQEERKEYINYYQELKKFPYLIESIQSYGASSLISLPENLENYTLETVLEDYLFSTKQEIISIEEKEVKMEVREEKSTTHTLFWKKIKQAYYHIDLYAYLGKARVDVIKKIGYERAKAKDFREQDLRGIDLSTVDFTDVRISQCDLRNTSAHIDPQKIHDKDLRRCNLEGLDLGTQDFTNVSIFFTNLKGTNAHIDPQKVSEKWLYGCNLEGLNLSDADFTGCYIYGANLEGTNAHINPQKIRCKNLGETNLRGLDLSNAYFRDVWIGQADLRDTNAHINPQSIFDQNLRECNLEGLDLSNADFTDVNIYEANLEQTNAFIDLNKIEPYSEFNIELEGIKKGNLSGCRVILSDDPLINEQFDFTNAMILDKEEALRKPIQRLERSLQK